MKQLLLAHRDLAFAAAKACGHGHSSIAVQAKCRTAAQTCREELFQAQRVLGNLGQVCVGYDCSAQCCVAHVSSSLTTCMAAQVAKSVLQRQTDLQLGVIEKSTELCQAFFHDFDTWVLEIKVRITRRIATAYNARDLHATY